MTSDQILQLIIGPMGAIVVLCAAIYFLWKLFREEQKENRANFATVTTMSQAMKDLTAELKVWRQAAMTAMQKKMDDVEPPS